MTAATTVETRRPPLELAEIFREYGAEYLQENRVSGEQRRVMEAVMKCRTAALGGHVEECDDCGYQRIAYNSCRDRHCPKCQSLKQALWVEARETELLPIEYFHVVFTLPHELNEIARWHPREVYDLLFEAASGTLQEFGRKELGGEIGATVVLHTWGQSLQQHIHLHCIVTGGALSEDGQRFRRSKQGHLFSVEALSAVYRERYCAGLRRWSEGLSEKAETAQEAILVRSIEQLSEKLREREWVVYAKRPMAGPEQVIEYLGRYTQRIAISNSRLIGMGEGEVSFTWKDYEAGGEVKVMKLPADEFIRRYLQHVLPKGYVRIRHYGLLASREREAKLARCRELLGAPEPEMRRGNETMLEVLKRLTGRDLRQCEQCGRGQMGVIEQWEQGQGPPRIAVVSCERWVA